MSTDGAACNLSRPGRTRRVVMGVATLISVGVIFWFVDSRVGTRWWRLVLVPEIFFGFLCLIQAQENTCVVLAARGQHEDASGKPVETGDLNAAAAARGRARKVWAMVIVATLVASALVLAAPRPLVIPLD